MEGVAGAQQKKDVNDGMGVFVGSDRGVLFVVFDFYTLGLIVW